MRESDKLQQWNFQQYQTSVFRRALSPWAPMPHLKSTWRQFGNCLDITENFILLPLQSNFSVRGSPFLSLKCGKPLMGGTGAVLFFFSIYFDSCNIYCSFFFCFFPLSCIIYFKVLLLSHICCWRKECYEIITCFHKPSGKYHPELWHTLPRFHVARLPLAFAVTFIHLVMETEFLLP